jgi:hypothetical protein
VPNDVNKALQRQSVLNDYYDKAQAKHAELRVELSPPEIIQIAQELARQSSLAGVPTSLLKRIVLGTPGLRNLYHPLKRVASIWRRMRS